MGLVEPIAQDLGIGASASAGVESFPLIAAEERLARGVEMWMRADVAQEARRLEEALRRIIDVFMAATILIVFAPVLLVAALAIAATSPGPIFFRHTRCGRYGRPFVCWKLRTMRANAELELLSDPVLWAEYSSSYKISDDPRVTSVGRILRRTSIDELPQLWNVIRGEMAMVGPRPVLELELNEKYRAAAAAVLSVPPGLTGLWQISGRSELSYEDRVRLDLEYISRRSLLLDLFIVVRTPLAVLTGWGAL